ncbi:MAG: REP-associated tyrosine transposase [Syntrophomonadales bacterium]|jgi:putative transposase
MARQSRRRSESGIYHIVMRGTNRQDIFHERDDYWRLLQIIAQTKPENNFELYGFCLMTNHVHLLIHEKEETIAKTMHRITTRYAGWYNYKYERSGHVFQGRYGSECVEDDRYLLTVIRYIHNNPVKAGMVSHPEDYRWSSIKAYYSGHKRPARLTNTSFILGIFAPERTEAVHRFREFMSVENQDTCLEDENRLKKTDEEIMAEIDEILKGASIPALLGMKKQDRDALLRKIKAIEGTTQRQIARVTGLNQSIISRA